MLRSIFYSGTVLATEKDFIAAANPRDSYQHLQASSQYPRISTRPLQYGTDTASTQQWLETADTNAAGQSKQSRRLG